MELELRHLRVIVTLSDAGSVSKAAAVLGVSQPSLTAQLQRIERAVGGRLFDRTSTGIQPTPLGSYVIGNARAVLVHMDNLHTGSEELRQTNPPVRFGGVPGGVVAGIVNRLGLLLPDSEITTQVDLSSTVILHLLDTGRLDGAVLREFPGFDLRYPGSVRWQTLVGVEPLFVAMAASHRLAEQTAVNLSDLAEEAWVNEPPDDSGLSVYFQEACTAVGFTPQVRHRIADPNTARGLVVSGQAVSLAQPTSRETDGLIVRPLTGDPLYRRLVLVWRRGGILAAHADQMYRCAVEAYLELVDRNLSYARWWAEHPETHPVV
ncbi:MAG TPA: LysR family transcriptional regulator [Mycobacteriales bacterium]|nr:LysR family transcriptional regulator [Mycobacteriales bacterium]